jgi:hypothetical protein
MTNGVTSSLLHLTGGRHSPREAPLRQKELIAQHVLVLVDRVLHFLLFTVLWDLKQSLAFCASPGFLAVSVKSC